LLSGTLARLVYKISVALYYGPNAPLALPSGARMMWAMTLFPSSGGVMVWIESISAGGGTDHEQALKLAIRLQPK